MHKLEYYGIRRNCLDWFRFYLKNRKQKVCIGNHLSDSLSISHGVPQGSVLGPFLFLLYINDLPSATKVLSPHLFADDITLFYSHSNISKLEENINTELEKISQWLIANKLSLNTSKSNYLIFSPNNKKSNKKIKIKINNTEIDEARVVKYLGVLIDNKLSSKAHVQQINLKISKGIGIIARLRHYVPRNILINIYNSFIQPHITYALINWGLPLKVP